MKNIRIIFAIALAGLSACQKKDNTKPDASGVTITITAPLPGQVYHSGDSVNINATVKYAGELHGYEVKITDSASGFVLYDDAEHVHNDHFEINNIWPYSGTQPVVLKLSLSTEIDHDGTTAEKIIYFQYQP